MELIYTAASWLVQEFSVDLVQQDYLELIGSHMQKAIGPVFMQIHQQDSVRL